MLDQKRYIDQHEAGSHPASPPGAFVASKSGTTDNYIDKTANSYPNWSNLAKDSDAFLYRNVPAGVNKKYGEWSQDEKNNFIALLQLHPPVNNKWGIFSKLMPGRTGFQCHHMYELMLEKKLIDPIDYRLYLQSSADEGSSLTSPASSPSSSPAASSIVSPNEKKSPFNIKEMILDGNDHCKNEKHSRRNESPWILLERKTNNKLIIFPDEQKPIKKDQFESAKIMEQNANNPIHLILLSFPVKDSQKKMYINSIRKILANQNQEALSLLTKIYFDIESQDDIKCKDDFINYVNKISENY